MVVLRHVVLFITLFLLVFTLSTTPGTYTESSQDTLTNEQPIVVVGDSNFSSADWHGNGSASSPYVLENVVIATNFSSISISNTSSYFIIRDCSFLPSQNGNAGTAVVLSNVTNGVIQDCRFEIPFPCLYAIFCSNVNLTGNTFGSAVFGIIIVASLDCCIVANQLNGVCIVGEDDVSLNISNNIINNSQIDSIYLYGVSYSYLAKNSLIHSYRHGLYMINSSFVTVSHNIISNSGEYGILASTSNCTFEGNSIENSHLDGVYVPGSGNIFSGNLFFNNTLPNAEDSGKHNTWEGNYWDDYVGLGSYPVDGTAGSQDPHPQSYPGILTPVQIAPIILVPMAILVVLYLIMKRRG